MFDDDITFIEWDFSPYLPVREDVTGEVVFSKKWQKLMITNQMQREQEVIGTKVKVDDWFVRNESSAFPILKVLAYGIPDTHDTRLASNMITWLGTNSGSLYLERAERLVEQGLDKKIAYLSAWVDMNIRRGAMIDRNMVPRDGLSQTFQRINGLDMIHNPLMTYAHIQSARDVETFDQVATWLGKDDGQKFIQSCQANLKIKFDRKEEERRAELQRRLTASPAQNP